MRTIRAAVLAVLLAGTSTASLAQESAPVPATAPPSAAPPPAAAPPAAVPTPPVTARGPVKDDEFIPTQELSADEQVTFPVDI